jgi:hypothetical protein
VAQQGTAGQRGLWGLGALGAGEEVWNLGGTPGGSGGETQGRVLGVGASCWGILGRQWPH